MSRGNKQEIDATLKRLLAGGRGVTVAEIARALRNHSTPSNTSRIVSVMFKEGAISCMPEKVWNDTGTPTTVWCAPGTKGSMTRDELIEATGSPHPVQPSFPWTRPSEGIETGLLSVMRRYPNGVTRARLAEVMREEPARVSCGLNALHRKTLVAKVTVPRHPREKGTRWIVTDAGRDA